jgi:ABC-type transport system involved in multi-copper enzyme maturation permease subunit
MFRQIFSFEIKYRLKRPATYIYFFIFFLFGFIAIATGSTPATEKVFHNAPWTLGISNVTFSLFMMLICSAIMGVPLYRDIEHNTRNYLFAYPISKAAYFWGRFLGSFLFVLIIGTAFNWGALLGSVTGPAFGWVPAERIGPNHLWNYFQPYFVFSIVNLFFPSAIFFALVALTRNVRVIYSASIFIFIGYLLANFLVRDLEKREIVKLLDPFALNTYNLETRFYTPAEKNTMILPVTNYVLYNRLIWLSVGVIIIVYCYFKFSFQQFLQPEKIKSRKRKKAKEESAAAGIAMPHVQIVFNRSYSVRVWWNLTKIEFFNVIRDNYFRAILLGGLIFLILDFWIGNTIYSVSNRPITIFLMDYKSNDYTVFIFIILLFYSGEAVHREKTTQFNVINDALPPSNTVFYFSKMCGIIGIAFILSVVPMIIGIIIQTLKGYTHYEPGIYLREMLLLTFPGFVQMILLSFAVHTIVNNKFAAHGITMLIWITMFLLRNYAHMDYNLFFYFYTPNYLWSDMNGLGHFAQPQFWFNFYWLCCGFMLALIAFLFYRRGVPASFRSQWRLAKQRYKQHNGWLIWLFLAGWLASGAYIYYNVSYLNTYVSFTDGEKRQVLYEKELKRYENIPQPKITDVKMKADIFPEDRKVNIYARIVLKNKTASPIDSLHLLAEQNVHYHILYDGMPLTYRSPLLYDFTTFTLFKHGKDTANYRIYKLPQTLKPGDSAVMEVFSEIGNQGFVNSGYTREIVYNGTFYSGGLPSIGYDQSREMESDEKRKKYNLPEKKDDLPDYTDTLAQRTLLFNHDADLVHFEATLSTSPDQIAVAPGYLKKTWTENGRKYFYYVQDSPVQDFFNIVSARYTILNDSVKLTDGKRVATQVFYHYEHPYNINRFNDAFKDGLVYYSNVYGDFQFRQMRLLEFPRYASFAQSFPNTVPYSEDFGWVADFSDPNSFDYGYFVTAHELAHQWWGHQVTPNATRGSNLISESLAEYSALILTERKYGSDNMKRFLKQELDDYLNGRANESKKENTFINCNRAYEWYNKGSLILYGLRDLIGDSNMNKALHEFRDSFALRENPPFPGSHDLYAFFKKHTPDSLQYYLNDTWEKITLYDNKLIKATSKKTGKGEYDVTLQFSTHKFYADSSGKESPAAMNDYIDVGVFAADSTDKNGRTKTNPLYLQKYKLKDGEHTITVHVKGEPVRAGIDPYNKLIDRIPDDNTGEIE